MGLGGMGMGMGMGGGYGMGGMGGHHGYRGGHHGYRGSSMRLPWMGVLAATAVAGGAAAVYPRGARSQVTWKEGSKQVSAQVREWDAVLLAQTLVLISMCCANLRGDEESRGWVWWFVFG